VRQAIVTKYFGPTDKRGPRIAAYADAGRVFRPIDDDADIRENSHRAAVELCRRFDWRGRLVAGGMPQKGSPFLNVYTFDEAVRLSYDDPWTAPEVVG